ncbi:gastric triacylglycerol lipase [Trichonephila clavipes]|uniref:Gastric triacylglycerol lipase n=1 Tax=Trichonephila clavipes TaxID=2585209 RepID=A0A8X6RNN3_TRICX|nr:gastric triacylglycerol lipase [Trichonephila clavipes]
MKTVTYRRQTNLTERVNRNLVHIIACFVEDNHENWDRFLNQFAFALRTSVNETMSKTPAELFLGRKIITPFSKLMNVTECAECVGRSIEKLFDEARQNMRKQHKTWEKYYNRKRREVYIKVNDLVLVQTHFISAAINIDQVRVHRPRQSDTISSDNHVEILYEGQRSSNGSSRSYPGKFKGSRKTSSEESKGRKSNKGNAEWEDPRLKRKTRIGVYGAHTPAGSSVKSVAHFGQMIESDFAKFDYGKRENIARYGQATPPKYNLSSITTPVALISGLNDNLADPADVAIVANQLKSLVSNYVIPLPDFNHIDFVTAIHGKKLVFDEVERLLLKYAW